MIYQDVWCGRITGKVSVKSEVRFLAGAGGVKEPVREDGGEDLVVSAEIPPGAEVGPGLGVLLQAAPPGLNVCTEEK